MRACCIVGLLAAAGCCPDMASGGVSTDVQSEVTITRGVYGQVLTLLMPGCEGRSGVYAANAGVRVQMRMGSDTVAEVDSAANGFYQLAAPIRFASYTVCAELPVEQCRTVEIDDAPVSELFVVEK